MLSTKLITTDNGISSYDFIPENIRSLVERRTTAGKIFGKLKIMTPQIISAEEQAPRNIIAGFLLDTSGSMNGVKLEHAINTIKKFVEVLNAERDGNTIKHQPFHSWIYVITFNSKTEVIIPFQEITEHTIQDIHTKLDNVRADGCTNYAIAFQKQKEVLGDIIKTLNNDAATTSVVIPGQQTPPPHYHVVRFFETDGDITEGSTNIPLLYDTMRSTAAPAAGPRITYEDVVVGYGTDVNLECLKQLAAPQAPSTDAKNQYNCSSLVTIIKPEDIGWQVGEILFKLIMRYGFNVKISIAATTTDATVELFEYQTHQWSSSTTLHSLIHGDNKPIWIQYTTPTSTTTTTTNIQVNIQFENQFTGKTYTYQFAHEIQENITIPKSITTTPTPTVQNKCISLVLGMIQIEIFKQFREIESTRYDKDTIVSEAYKTIRMLKTLEAMMTTPTTLLCQTLNLITDVKVIIGLTTIESYKEQNIILHARRICSAENELYNTGATVSRKYIENEENYEEEAKAVIAANANANANANEYEYEMTDALPSRIPTHQSYNDDDAADTPFYGGGHHTPRYNTRSELRTLCVKIALARANNQDITAEQLYEQMKMHNHYYQDDDATTIYHYQDDTFSSTPMDDAYTQRRMGMMRQMS